MKSSVNKACSGFWIIVLVFFMNCEHYSNSHADFGNKSGSPDSSSKVTFIELGSVKCIPCQKMQVVMKSVEEKYGDQVKVVFYDVRTPEGKLFADQYNIKLIPTQIFLDKNGMEYFRHEGFFPEEDLVKVLQENGVK